MSINRIRVQLIEDNPADALCVVEALRGESGISVQVTDCLSRAVEYLSSGRTDVALLDLGLPDSQGLDALRIISEAAPHVPIVVLTENDDPAVGQRTIELGAQDFLTKPVMAGPILARILRFAIERKRAVLALRSRDARYRQLYESMMDGFVSVDMQGHIMECNSSFQTMLGYSADELRSLTYIQLTPERWHRMEAEIVAGQIIPRGYSDAYEKEYRCKSGETIPVELRTSLLKDDSGAPTGMWAIVRDLTERKQAEENLRINEARLSNALKIALLGHWEFDVASDSFTFNDQFYAVMRTTVAKEGGYVLTASQYVDRFVHPDDRFIVRKEFEKNSKSVDTRYAGWIEHRMIYGDGEVGYVSVRFFAIMDDRGLIVKTNGVSQDITERKRVEEALIKSEAQYRLIANNTTDVIWLFDLALDRFIYISPSVERLWGFNVEEALHSTMQDILTPESFRMLAKELPKRIAAFRSGDDSMRTQTYELQQLRKDGSIVMTETAITLIPDKHRSVGRQIQGIARDITERKSLQGQLLQAQKMEAVGRLAGGVAHDFNNLLTIIIGYSDSLLKDFPQSAPGREELELIRKSGNRAAALTSKLLAFSRKQILQVKVIDPKTIIQDSLAILRRIIGEDIELITDIAPNLGFIKTDLTQIEQVIMNLAINSKDAMPGGGKLILSAENASLDEAFAINHIGAHPGEYVVLAVSDTGTGMDANTKSHLFEPFFTTKEMGKGTGLGLATVYGIVSQSGGFINVNSELKQGTTFTIYLPRVEACEEPAQLNGTISRNGSETILVVEDADDVRALTSRFLQESGYTVLSASDGPSAIKTAKQHAGVIHLLISDMVMPGGMNGCDVYKSLLDSYPNIRVLIMTGYIGEMTADYSLDPEIHVLQKPFSAEDLLQLTHKALQRKIVT